eukprot:CAMPEP_0204123362 /NCGR_PEP_ID=MMETSP0361-20130328/9248_1 /ASSEMBLY_ACC=CAM_ASM_000343 /TAXON_ID=268821 /ORGANISM="Scrippsiella Hangoei, Strain SHTV-5" /LENGTH=110 /DNA_ID=CAMNT_0051074803 /DNA_START=362 /DNA_END=691 /DNA_ORIENTATION=-
MRFLPGLCSSTKDRWCEPPLAIVWPFQSVLHSESPCVSLSSPPRRALRTLPPEAGDLAALEYSGSFVLPALGRVAGDAIDVQCGLLRATCSERSAAAAIGALQHGSLGPR